MWPLKTQEVELPLSDAILYSRELLLAVGGLLGLGLPCIQLDRSGGSHGGFVEDFGRRARDTRKVKAIG